MTEPAALSGFQRSKSTARPLPAAGGWLLAGAADTGGQFTLIQTVVPAGDNVPLHRHATMDESFSVLAGAVHVTCGDDRFDVSSGGFVFMPRGRAHRYVAGPDGAELLILTTPGGFEGFFDDWEAGASLEECAQLHDFELLE